MVSANGESGASVVDVRRALSGAIQVATGALAEVAAVIDPNISVRDTCARRGA